MLEAMVSAADHLFAPGPLLAMAIVLPLALLSGLMPAGGLPITAVVLGFAAVLDPWVAITAVVFNMAAGDITEPVPAILLGIPGARSAQATVLDGYPMSRQGKAGVALGASYTTTLVGGIFGAAVLLAVLPLGRELLRNFGSAEFFLLSLMGIMAVAVVSAGAIVKGLLVAFFGLSVAMIGWSDIGGISRSHFGIGYLWDGIDIIPLVIGLFALPEAISLIVSDRPIARENMEAVMKDANRDVLTGMRIAFRHKWLMIRSSAIGTFVGAMPGVGGSAAHWIAYVSARQTEKGGRETFGKGDVRGVIAADAANNSVDAGVLIPTVVFGIPGSGSMALVLTILILNGIEPGPSMMTTHLDLTIAMVYIIVIGNVVVVPIMLLWAPYLTRLTLVSPNLLGPIVIGVVTLAAFQATQAIQDLVVVLAFMVLGLFMKWFGWPRPPVLIAVALADSLERYLWISTNAFGGTLFYRPQSLAIIAVMVITMAFGVKMQRKSSGAVALPPVDHEDAGLPEKTDAS
jgi:TctA family transporter